MPEDQGYESIRQMVIDIIANSPEGDFTSLRHAVAEKIQSETSHEDWSGLVLRPPIGPQLSHIESALLTEVFWDLFRDGIITLGMNTRHTDTASPYL